MAENVRRHNRFPYEADFYDKPSFIEIRRRHGWAGVGMVFALCGHMWRRSGTRIAFDELAALAYNWHIEPGTALLEIVTTALQMELFEELCTDQAQLELCSSNAQAKLKLLQVKSRQDDQDKTSKKERRAFHCPFVTREAEEYEARMLSIRTRGGKGGRVSADNRAVAWPEAIDTPECRAAWTDWLEHKKERGESYKSAKSQQAKLTELSKLGPQRFIAAILHSRGNNYAGIYEAKSSGNGYHQPQPAGRPQPKRLPPVGAAPWEKGAA
jgi:hypothetical protein